MKKYLSAIILFFVFSAIYYLGSFTKIPFADCIGFVLSIEKGEYETVATPLSHFLYINTGIFIKGLTGLHAIEASRFLVVASGAATVALIYLIVNTITKTQWTAITTAFVFGFSFSFWRNAEIVEVYTYNCLWISLFFFSIVKTFIEKKNFYIILSSLFLGIALWVHIENILLIPALFLFLFYFRMEKQYVYPSFILFILLFSSLSILNMSQGLPFNAFYSTGQSWVKDSLKQPPLQLIKDFFQSFIYLIYNFNIFIFFGIAGISLLYKTNRKMFTVFFIAALMVYGFSTFYLVPDNYVFFLPFNIIFALSIGYGLSSVKYSSFKRFSWVCLLIPLSYVFIFQIVILTEKGKEVNSLKEYKGGISYYLLPWMNDNIGILEFTIDHKIAPEPIDWMTESAKEYIQILKSKGYTDNEIRKL
ncbi:protein O-mannosyl-transferase family [Chryseobacterium contaminans]|uniref:protein O-mannosyl-transferase family n=1 Tax=Chryseobacterium contaminans TaxID=1423959 RepID=UPI0030158CE7